MPQVKEKEKKEKREEKKKFHLDSNKFGFICVGISNVGVIKKKSPDISNVDVIKEMPHII